MANEKNIFSFTAIDIEKYHRNMLTPKERNALEKAAVDDPFLADALDGFGEAPNRISTDMAALQLRLQNRVAQQAKSIPIELGSENKFRSWLKIAALILVVAGAGMLSYQLAFNKKEKQAIANNEMAPEKTITIMPTDSRADSLPAVQDQNKSSRVNAVTKKDKTVVHPHSTEVATNSSLPEEVNTEKIITAPLPQAATIPPPAIAEQKDGITKNDKKNLQEKNEVARNITIANKQKTLQNAESNAPHRVDNYSQPTIFRGRVTDAQNNGLPFAAIINPEENVGTYADMNGYFNLTSLDTNLNVQIRSVGFDDYNYQLRNSQSLNQITLQEDTKLRTQVISTRRINAERKSRNNSISVEEAEPLAGWDNYDIYIANNLQVPDEIKTKQSTPGEVELSFNVNKYGNPINIRVEKSLCKSCDEEAIRLLKAGPKFKQKKKKERTTVAVPFIQN